MIEPNHNTKSFASIYGSPGEAPRVVGLLKAFWPLLLICLLLGYIIRVILPFPDISSYVGIILVIISLLGIYLLSWGNRKLGNYLKGARGEEWVAKQLSFLNSSYSIFHGIRLNDGNSNFDHIVVGPTGIFIVETKNWSGKVTFDQGKVFIDGKKLSSSPIQQVKSGAADLFSFFENEGLKNVPIKNVICFLGADLDHSISNINGIIICKGEVLINVITDELNDLINEDTQKDVAKILQKALI